MLIHPAVRSQHIRHLVKSLLNRHFERGLFFLTIKKGDHKGRLPFATTERCYFIPVCGLVVEVEVALCFACVTFCFVMLAVS